MHSRGADRLGAGADGRATGRAWVDLSRRQVASTGSGAGRHRHDIPCPASGDRQRLFALCYLLFWPETLSIATSKGSGALDGVDRATLVSTAAFAFLAPAVLAVTLHAVTVFRGGHRGHEFLQNFITYSPVPTAWDFAAANRRPCFIRILTADNTWIGGYAGQASFVSGFPQPRDVYVEIAYQMDVDGAFIAPVEGSAGMWISCSDAKLLQLVEVPSSDTGGEIDGQR